MTPPDHAETMRRVNELIAALIAAQPADQFVQRKKKAKEFVRNTLDNGPSRTDSDAEKLVWQLTRVLGYSPGFDPFYAFADIVPLIDNYR